MGLFRLIEVSWEIPHLHCGASVHSYFLTVKANYHLFLKPSRAIGLSANDIGLSVKIDSTG